MALSLECLRISNSLYCKGSTSRDVLREVLAGDTVDFLLKEEKRRAI